MKGWQKKRERRLAAESAKGSTIPKSHGECRGGTWQEEKAIFGNEYCVPERVWHSGREEQRKNRIKRDYRTRLFRKILITFSGLLMRIFFFGRVYAEGRLCEYVVEF